LGICLLAAYSFRFALPFKQNRTMGATLKQYRGYVVPRKVLECREKERCRVLIRGSWGFREFIEPVRP
jgi:hypothetical protein